MELYAPEVFNGAKLVGVFDNGSDDWHAARADGIGGSEVGTILGLNPYESAYALWAKKTGKIPSQIQENWAIRFGKAFEAPILQLWAEEHPEFEVFETGTYQDGHCGYLHANPDALARHRETGEWIVIEVKTSRNSWDYPPLSYIAQVMHYMGVLKVKRSVIVAVAGMTWFEEWVMFNEDSYRSQLDMIEQFWYSLQNDRKPAWDGSESTYNAVRMQHDSIDDVEVDMGELGYDLMRAQQTADSAYTKLMELKSRTLHAMGTAKWATVTEGQNVRRIASRQIRAGNPSLIVNKKERA
jgi:putative phage-type endonuclease